MDFLRDMGELEALYQPAPSLASTAKESDSLTPEYRRLVELSPFVTLATSGPEGLDCSPRGDARGFVRVLDARTLAMPDRRGNNRIDSLRNIIRDPRVALLFLIPGSGTAFRVNGKARLTADPALCEGFAVDGSKPRCVIIITIERCYFQCARAIHRAQLWDPAQQVPQEDVPSPGTMLERSTGGKISAADYDSEWPVRAKNTLW
jgi:PPOX class probable FMN-dependent enzyme